MSVARRPTTFDELADLARDAMASALASAATDLVACLQSVDAAKREALYQNARAIFSTQVRRRYGGGDLRLYVPKADAAERQACAERVASADAQPVDIAKRERMSERHVRRLRGRFGPP